MEGYVPQSPIKIARAYPAVTKAQKFTHKRIGDHTTGPKYLEPITAENADKTDDQSCPTIEDLEQLALLDHQQPKPVVEVAVEPIIWDFANLELQEHSNGLEKKVRKKKNNKFHNGLNHCDSYKKYQCLRLHLTTSHDHPKNARSRAEAIFGATGTRDQIELWSVYFRTIEVYVKTELEPTIRRAFEARKLTVSSRIMNPSSISRKRTATGIKNRTAEMLSKTTDEDLREVILEDIHPEWMEEILLKEQENRKAFAALQEKRIYFRNRRTREYHPKFSYPVL
jgi:hypothetical protein